MMAEERKRKASDEHINTQAKRSRGGGKKWRVNRHAQSNSNPQKPEGNVGLSPGDAGVWATCELGREGKCVMELKSLFDEYIERLYGAEGQGQGRSHEEHEEGSPSGDEDIEAEIKRELHGMKKPASRKLFEHVRLDIQCVMFFRTRKPVDPVKLVHAICEDAFSLPGQKRTRWVKRLTPVTLIGKATEKGVEEVAQQVLAPHFHFDLDRDHDYDHDRNEGRGKRFAIRPTIRNHNTLTRDGIIRKVAAAVGPGHKVDLKGYNLLILVEVYKNICGMSVVPSDFEKLKRYNLSELFDPATAAGQPSDTSESNQTSRVKTTANLPSSSGEGEQ
ncbi:hypothetical protein L228DRAFT_286365 [Xylona heveae TC161]|uniref:THUMP domain-containing protein n=1 Tax=Xylona heveae (strain CBS 132557 / TC161) TaxID=1328760 RepID=A0A164ZAI3_XYLHT|nr:hypothetical protein L228DRAFT_286365 [Xylona heveae TC161]KZF18871.1 hypothetical protein L228DRAFT_286365 [Xylona heveae TC161]